MDKTILNGSKIRFYNQGNSQSGSIQYTDSALIIKSNVTLGTSSANTIISNGKFTASAGIQSTFVSGSGLFTSNTGFTTSDYAKIGGVITAGSHINSPTFLPGYTGYGWMISKSTIPSTRYTAIFDDLWVRGSMNVYEMVINQIRSTNGSLWISDASKATSASYSSAANALILQFQTGSLVPFIAGDIIRSKRWGTSGSTILSQWDITTTISNINYITGYATISAPLSNNDYTITGSSNGSWTQLAQKLSVSGSQWVRVGNISQFSNRRGSIYLTSNDLGGPFIDVYDNVTSSVEATGGSGNVSGSKTKVRLGNLSGITDINISPNPLSGYGLYADNVYLRGTVSATQGTFSGTVYARDGVFSGSISSSAGQIADWSIQEDNFNNGNLYLGQSDFYSQDGDIFIGAVNDQGYINFGNKLIFSNSSLAIDGTISAEAGTIGGWQINQNSISSSGIVLVPGTSPYIGIGSTQPSMVGIWMGYAAVIQKYVFQAYKDSTHWIQWDGDAFGIRSDNFTLSKAGNISASNAILGGQIRANSGYIGGSSGWIINSSKITSSGIELLGGATPAIKIGNASAFNTGTGIFMSGSSNTSYLRVGQTSGSGNTYLLWNGTNLSWQTPNFTMSTAGTMTITGSVNATAGTFTGKVNAGSGTIGGWTINSNGLSSSNVTISSQTNYQGIRITTASTTLNIDSSLNYIYLGKWNGNNVLHLKKDANNYFKWDANGLNISSPKLTLTPTALNISGSITTSAGLIGGWNINSGGISSIHSYGTVSITKSGASNLALTDTYGNFTYSAANSNLYSTSVNKYLVDSVSTVTDFNRYESGITISQAKSNQGFGVQINHLFGDIVPLFVFTVSGLTINKEYILQSRLENLTVQGFGTPPKLAGNSLIFCWITPTPEPWDSMEVLGAENPLWGAYAESNNLVKQYRMTPTSTTTYLWVGGTIATIESNFSLVAKFTFSGFRIDSFKQYTELSQKGLLVFNSPENYLQLSSENDYLTNSSKGSLGLLNVEELYVNGTSINDRINNPISVFNGGTGTNSFAHRQFLWYDTQSGMITASGFSSSSGGSAPYSHPVYTGITLSGANVISSISVNSAGTLVTASRALTAADISAAKSSTTVTGTGLLGGGGSLTTNITITHNIANGAYHLPANGSVGQLIMYSGTAGSGSWTSDIQTNGTASFASITASAGFTSSTGNIAVGGSITSSQVVKAKYFDANPNYGYQFSSIGAIKVDQVHGTALDLQDFGSLKIGNTNNYGTSSCTFLQGKGNTASGEIIHIQGYSNSGSGKIIHIQGYSNSGSGEIIHIQGYSNSGSGEIIHIEGSDNRAEVNYGHTQGYNAIGHIVGSKTFANGSMDGQFPRSTTQVSTIVLYAYNLIDRTFPLINKFYSTGKIDFNRAGLAIDKLHISFFLNVMITYRSLRSVYAYQQTFTYNYDGSSTEINTGAPYGDVSATTGGISTGDIGNLELVQDDVGVIYFTYAPKGNYEINSVIVKVEMIEHIAYVVK